MIKKSIQSPKENPSIKQKLQVIRLVFLTWFIIEKILYFYVYGLNTFSRMGMFLTEWGKFITTFFLITTFFQLFRNKPLMHSKIFHLCLALEFLITIFFWVVLFKGMKFFNHVDRVVTYSEHFIYFIYLVIEFAFNDIMLSKSSLKVLIGVLAFNNSV